MTKEELKQIYYLNKELKMWQEELNRLECKSLIKGQEITGMPFVGGTSDSMANMAVEIADTKRTIDRILTMIQHKRKVIMDYIESVDDSYIRQIIYLRNVSCMSWYQVAKEIGSTENATRMTYDRFFKKQ